MDKDYEENNLSIISNEELQDLTDYSTSLMASSSLASPNSTYHRNNNQYSNYSQRRMPPQDMMGGMYGAYGSSSDWDWIYQKNPVSKEAFRKYMDLLTVYLYKSDPEGLQYFLDNVTKCKNGEMELLDVGRTTPLLFPEVHALAKLNFPGLLYQLIPNALNQTGGIITITDEIYPKHFVFQTDDYPGPLTLEKTTEEQLFYYLKDQMSSELQNSSPADCDSGYLLINYLELLIKENGKPRISNVVRLLNDGVETKTANLRKDYKAYNSISRNSFSRSSSRATSIASSKAASPEREENLDPDLPQNTLDNPQGPGSVSSIMRKAVNTVSNDQKLYQNMDKYREYIFSGRFEEAVNFATRSGIWDHAFALAMRMNNQALVNDILVKFSRRAIFENDPLYTMHELMAARMPKIVATNRGFSSKPEHEIGDWRSHLSMILAVKKFRSEESRQAIELMGEKLILLRSYFASHLCFLLAGTPFGIDKTAHKYRRKFDLIGWSSSTSNIPAQKSTYSNCHKLFCGLDYWRTAPEPYIKLTEIYEYVLRLRGDDSHKTLAIHLLPYKYLMLYKMLSRHQIKNACEYCKNIGEILGYKDVNWFSCESVTFQMVSNIRELSYKLHSLLSREEESHDTDEDNTWLNNIDEVYCMFCEKYNFYNPKSMKPENFVSQLINYSNDSESLSDTGSQMKRDVLDSSFLTNNYTESFSNANYSSQQFNRQMHKEVIPPANTSYQNYKPHQNVTNTSHINDDEHHRSVYDNSFSNRNASFHRESIKSDMMSSSTQNVGQYSQYKQVLPDQLHNNKVYQRPQDKHAFTNSNFGEILPPFEIPKEMTMTSPPRRLGIKNTNSSSLERESENNLPSHVGQNEFNMGYEGSSIMTPQRPTNMENPQNFINSTQRLPTLPQKQTNSSYPSDNSQFQHSNNAPNMGNSTSKPYQIQPPMFMPVVYQDLKGSNETIDCFNTTAYSRSRSQSNGSVGSGDSQIKSSSRQPINRSRNSSESKEIKLLGHLPSRPLEPTKEENEQMKQDKPKSDVTINEKKSGWNPLGWLKNKQKEIHLPDDDSKQLEYDAANNKWVDKSDPNSNKPPTPPPKMPLSSPQFQYGSGFGVPSSLYQGPASPILQKYRLATPNVKPSINVPSTSMPFIPTPMANVPSQQHYNNYESFEGENLSRNDNNQYNYYQKMDSYKRAPQPSFNQSYDSNIYQEKYNGRGNE